MQAENDRIRAKEDEERAKKEKERIEIEAFERAKYEPKTWPHMVLVTILIMTCHIDRSISFVIFLEFLLIIS